MSMIEHRYYKELDARNVHIHHLAKDQGVPFKIDEVYAAAVAMIAQEGGK